jgi:hypothetical protein
LSESADSQRGQRLPADAIQTSLAATAHRPWPMPQRPWVMYQSWQRLLFAHWPMDATELRPHVPPPLDMDLRDGRAWIAVTPFHLAELRGRGMPRMPGATSFPELNVRTYVRYGDRPGVFFFSLDAGSRLAVTAASALYALPYRHARMSIQQDGEWLRYHCDRAGSARFDGRYRPVGSAAVASAGSLEEFLTERYALYAVPRPNHVLRAEIHHPPWLLRPAEAEITRNTMARASGIDLPDRAPVLHYSERQDVVVWLPEKV